MAGPCNRQQQKQIEHGQANTTSLPVSEKTAAYAASQDGSTDIFRIA